MKKFASVLLSLVLMFGLMPMVYAEEAPAFTIKPQYDETRSFHEGLAAVNIGGKWGYIDKTGTVIVQPKYKSAFNFSEGLAGVRDNENKWGFIDKTGKEVIKPQYSGIYADSEPTFSEGLAAVPMNDKVGFIDKSGKQVIEPKYDKAYYFSEGLAAVLINGKLGFIDKTGKTVIDLKYGVDEDEYSKNRPITFSEGLARVRIGVKWGFIDKTGKEVIEPKFDGAFGFRDGLAAIEVEYKVGFIDKTGKEIIKPTYSRFFSDSYAFKDGVATVSHEDELASFIDKTGNEVVPHGSYMDLREGLAAVLVNNKWGFVDKTGKEIIKPQYEASYAATGEAYIFSEGLAAVSMSGKWGFISNPLTSSASVNNSPATSEKRIETKQGGYVIVSNVIEEKHFTDEGAGIGDTIYVVNAPVSIKVHGDNFKALGKQPLTYLPKAKYVNGSFDMGDTQEDIEMIDNYTLALPGYYAVSGVFGSEYSPDTTLGFVLQVTGNENAETWSGTMSATPTASKVLINGKEVSFEGYNINGNNYFKLRDLAMAVKGTEKKFAVGWDLANNAISLESGKSYIATGGELTVSDKLTNKEAKSTNSKIYFEGKEVQFTAYNIGGNNYFMLRDIANVINFGVTWDGKANMIGIDSKSEYKEEK